LVTEIQSINQSVQVYFRHKFIATQ